MSQQLLSTYVQLFNSPENTQYFALYQFNIKPYTPRTKPINVNKIEVRFIHEFQLSNIKVKPIGQPVFFITGLDTKVFNRKKNFRLVKYYDDKNITIKIYQSLMNQHFSHVTDILN